MALSLDDAAQAGQYLREALVNFYRHGSKWSTESCLGSLAAVAAQEGRQINCFTTAVFDLLDLGERQAVLDFFEECHVFWRTGRDRLAGWTKDIQAGHKPDFGPGFHFHFKRLQK